MSNIPDGRIEFDHARSFMSSAPPRVLRAKNPGRAQNRAHSGVRQERVCAKPSADYPQKQQQKKNMRKKFFFSNTKRLEVVWTLFSPLSLPLWNKIYIEEVAQK
jgi:hypothetical protein